MVFQVLCLSWIFRILPINVKAASSSPLVCFTASNLVSFHKALLDILVTCIVGCRGVVARGSSAGLFLIGPTKVKALKFILFTENPKSLKVKNKEHLFDFVVILYFTSLCCNALPSSKVSQSTFIL